MTLPPIKHPAAVEALRALAYVSVRALLDDDQPDVVSAIAPFADALGPADVGHAASYAHSVQAALTGQMDAKTWRRAVRQRLAHELGMDTGTHLPAFLWPIIAEGALNHPAFLVDIPAMIEDWLRAHALIDAPLNAQLSPAGGLALVTMACSNARDFPRGQRERLKPILDEIATVADWSQAFPTFWDQWALVRAYRLWQMERWPAMIEDGVRALPLYQQREATDSAPEWFRRQIQQLL